MEQRSIYRMFMQILVVAMVVTVAGCGDDVTHNDPVCQVGQPCDDGDSSTKDDVYTLACECKGTIDPCAGFQDADGDGVCSNVDCDDQDDQITATDEDGDGICGDIDCDDGDAQITEVDADNDGYCASEDCNDNAPSYYPGAPCDDGNPNTIDDIVTMNCECMGHNPYGTLTDQRDGQVYRTLEVGQQTIMADNLKYNSGNSWCYDDDPALCALYGRLYNWEGAQEGCPVGWHIPSNEEWDQLINSFGGDLAAGGAMKATVNWNPPNTGATNSSGFGGLPGGCRGYTTYYNMLGISGFWWSTTFSNNENNVFTPALNNATSDVLRISNHAGDAFSIRCFKD